MASQVDLANQLLQRACDDQAAAEALLHVDSVTDVIVGFHAQQGVEKSIKAVLAVHGVDFPFTHDVGRLAVLAKRAGHPLPDDLRDADGLTVYAGALRYDPDDPKSVDRETALRWVTAAVTWARAQLDAAVVGPDEDVPG
jgi:HEPN domain-containing protein